MPENNTNPSPKELGERIDKAKKKALGYDGKEERSVSSPGAMHVSIDLLAGVIGGSFVGYYLDKWLGTLPLFFITCFFLGIAGAVRNIMKSIRNAEKLDN